MYQIKSLIFSKDTFKYTNKSLFTDEFYDFLAYVVDCVKADIVQDDDFDNHEILYTNLDGLKKNFSFFLNLKYILL